MKQILNIFIYLILFNQLENKQLIKSKQKRGAGTLLVIGGTIFIATIVAGSALGTAGYLLYTEKLENGQCKLIGVTNK